MALIETRAIVFVAFQSAKSAVGAAAEIQWALAAHDWPEGLLALGSLG